MSREQDAVIVEACFFGEYEPYSVEESIQNVMQLLSDSREDTLRRAAEKADAWASDWPAGSATRIAMRNLADAIRADRSET